MHSLRAPYASIDQYQQQPAYAFAESGAQADGGGAAYYAAGGSGEDGELVGGDQQGFMQQLLSLKHSHTQHLMEIERLFYERQRKEMEVAELQRSAAGGYTPGAAASAAPRVHPAGMTPSAYPPPAVQALYHGWQAGMPPEYVPQAFGAGFPPGGHYGAAPPGMSGSFDAAAAAAAAQGGAERYYPMPMRDVSPPNTGRRAGSAPVSSRRLSVASSMVAFGSCQPPDDSQRAKSWKKRTTAPKSFSFEKREGNKSHSIAQRRLEADIAMKKAMEEAEMSKRFVAQPVPPSTLLPRFKQIMEEQERRRMEQRKRLMETAKKREKPFGLGKRDTDKDEPRRSASAEPERVEYKPFRANPIPLTSMIMTRNVEEEEEKRRKKILDRAQKLLDEAVLPPRMELWAKANADKEKKDENKDPTQFMPKVNHNIPNFKALQAQFFKALDAKKQSKAKTVPKPFHFNPPREGELERIRRDAVNDQQVLPETRWPFASSRRKVDPTPPPKAHSPKIRPATTLSTELRKHVVRKSLERMRAKELLALKEEKERMEKRREAGRRLARFLVSNAKDFELRNMERREQFLHEERERARVHRRKMRQLRKRVAKSKYLFQRVTTDDAKRRARDRFRKAVEEVGLNADEFSDVEVGDLSDTEYQTLLDEAAQMVKQSEGERFDGGDSETDSSGDERDDKDGSSEDDDDDDDIDDDDDDVGGDAEDDGAAHSGGSGAASAEAGVGASSS